MEIDPYLEALRSTSRIAPQTPPHPSTSEVGRFLRKRHVRGHGLPQNRTAWRSILICEARRNGGFIGLHSGFPPQPQPHPSASEVGRFLRKRHVGRHGPPQSRTAWRSVLIYEARRNGGFIGLHSGFPPQTPPHPSTSEVGRFLRKRHVGRHGPPQSRTAWRSILIYEARRSTSRVVPLAKRNDSMGSVVLAASSFARGSLKVSL